MAEGRYTKTVFSDFINIQPSVDACCQSPSFSGKTSLLSLDTPALSGNTAVFQFPFTLCSSVQAYDTANITLYSTGQSEQCGGEGALMMDMVSVFSNSKPIILYSFKILLSQFNKTGRGSTRGLRLQRRLRQQLQLHHSQGVTQRRMEWAIRQQEETSIQPFQSHG